MLALRWSVKYFYAPNSPIFRKSCGEVEHTENRQLQGILLFKQTQLNKGKWDNIKSKILTQTQEILRKKHLTSNVKHKD